MNKYYRGNNKETNTLDEYGVLNGQTNSREIGDPQIINGLGGETVEKTVLKNTDNKTLNNTEEPEEIGYIVSSNSHQWIVKTYVKHLSTNTLVYALSGNKVFVGIVKEASSQAKILDPLDSTRIVIQNMYEQIREAENTETLGEETIEWDDNPFLNEQTGLMRENARLLRELTENSIDQVTVNTLEVQQLFVLSYEEQLNKSLALIKNKNPFVTTPSQAEHYGSEGVRRDGRGFWDGKKLEKTDNNYVPPSGSVVYKATPEIIGALMKNKTTIGHIPASKTPYAIDLRKATTQPIFIGGQTGKGKTYLATQLFTKILLEEVAHLIIIDPHDDYVTKKTYDPKTLSNWAKGRVIEYSLSPENTGNTRIMHFTIPSRIITSDVMIEAGVFTGQEVPQRQLPIIENTLREWKKKGYIDFVDILSRMTRTKDDFGRPMNTDLFSLDTVTKPMEEMGVYPEDFDGLRDAVLEKNPAYRLYALFNGAKNGKIAQTGMINVASFEIAQQKMAKIAPASPNSHEKGLLGIEGTGCPFIQASSIDPSDVKKHIIDPKKLVNPVMENPFDHIEAILRKPVKHAVIFRNGLVTQEQTRLFISLMAKEMFKRFIRERMKNVGTGTGRDNKTTSKHGELGKTLLSIDEAHNYLSPKYGFVPILSRISKEGRKYGLLPIIITQNFKTIEEDITSMTGLRFVFSMTDPEDMKKCFGVLLPLREWEKNVANLPTGQCLIVGTGTPFPAIVKIPRIEDELKNITRNHRINMQGKTNTYNNTHQNKNTSEKNEQKTINISEKINVREL